MTNFMPDKHSIDGLIDVLIVGKNQLAQFQIEIRPLNCAVFDGNVFSRQELGDKGETFEVKDFVIERFGKGCHR
jgi:hypothetical protein